MAQRLLYSIARVGLSAAAVMVMALALFGATLFLSDLALGRESASSLWSSARYVDYSLIKTRGDAVFMEHVVDELRHIDPDTRHELNDGVHHVICSRETDPVEVKSILRRKGYASEQIKLGYDLGLVGAGVVGNPFIFGLLLFGQFAAMAVVGWFEIRRTSRDATDSVLRAVGIGAVVGVIAVGVAFLIETGLGWFGAPVKEQPWVADAINSGGITAAIFVVLIAACAPIAEEVFFRGHIFRYLGEQINRPFGYVVSAWLFAMIHMNPSGILVYFVYGLLLAYAMERGKSLISAIVAHMVVNASAVITLLAFS